MEAGRFERREGRLRSSTPNYHRATKRGREPNLAGIPQAAVREGPSKLRSVLFIKYPNREVIATASVLFLLLKG